jgi:hypothetical protein
MKFGKWNVRFGIAAVVGILAAIPATGSLASAGIASAAPSSTHGPLISSASSSINWSGYAVKGGTGSFTSVSAAWVQPTGTCTSKATYSAFWVGLDGYSNDTVEQDGSEVDCHSGSPKYYAWWEMYPKPSINFSNTVDPGDHFTASVTASGDTFTLKISDTTQGWSHTVTKTLSTAKKASAEVIAEAPCCTSAGNILPLTNFGTVDFSVSKADGSPIGDNSPVKINMAPGDDGGTKGVSTATTSSLSGGQNFSVTWKGN